MSTVYDALRRAELERKKIAVNGDPAIGSVENKNNGLPENVKVILLLLAVTFVFGVVVYRINSARAAFSSKSASVKVATAQPAVVAPNKVAVSAGSVSAKPVRAPGTYGLDGVINAGAASMAIVNGRLLRVDENIDHLILKKISPNAVEMLNTRDNSLVVLKL